MGVALFQSVPTLVGQRHLAVLAQEVGWALPTNPKTLWWAVPTLH